MCHGLSTNPSPTTFFAFPGPMPGMQNRSTGDSWRWGHTGEACTTASEPTKMTFISKIIFSGKEPPWGDPSHPNGHSQSSSLDQVYSWTTGKTHPLQSNPQFFSLAIPPGFSGKGKNSIKCWFYISFPLSIPACALITFYTEFIMGIFCTPQPQLLFWSVFFPCAVLSLTAMCRVEPRESWGALGVWGRTATLNTWLSKLVCGLAELDTWKGEIT